MGYLKENVPNFDSLESFREPEQPTEPNGEDGRNGSVQPKPQRSRTISNLLHVSGAEDGAGPARVSS